MNLPKFSINRPVTISMLFIALIVIGFVSYQGLGLDLLPDMSFPVSAIMVSYPGAAPEEMEALITIPLEEVVSTVHRVDTINSISQEGNTVLLLSFQWGTNMDIAILEVREKIDQVKRILPEGAGDPSVIKFDPSMMPIMVLGINSEQYSLHELDRFARLLLKPRLERIEGIASASVSGGVEREILVSVDNEKLRANSLTLDQVVMALRSENINLPAGTLREGNVDFLIRTLGRFESIADIENVIISTVKGNQIPLKEIARISDTFKKQQTVAYINGYPSISLTLQKESGTNTVIVANRVNSELNTIKNKGILPGDTKAITVFDSSDFIKKAIKEVSDTLLIGAVLTMLVLYAFLHSIKSTLIIGFSIPISVISTFTLLYFAKLTLNMMTLGGLALGIGILVDNSIVVLENVFRHRELGKDAALAAELGANEVADAITASTLTTIAVFLPVVYVSGIAGELFKTMGLTIAFSLLMSLFVALTLVPMLFSRSRNRKILSPSSDAADRSSSLTAKEANKRGFFNAVRREYSYLIDWALRHRGIMVLMAIAILVLSFTLLPLVGAEFFPAIDQGNFSINISLPVGTNFEVTREIAREIEKVVHSVPEIENVFTTVGSGSSMDIGGSGGNNAAIMATLIEKGERERDSSDIIAELRDRIGEYPDTQIRFSEQNLSLTSGAALTINISGDSLGELDFIANTIMSLLSEVEGIYDLQSSVEEVRPELHIAIDREKVNLYGLSAGQVASNVHDALLGKVAGYFQEGGERYNITVKLEKSGYGELQELENMMISSNYGLQVPLKEIARVEVGIGPQGINRENQQRQVQVTGNVSGRFLGSVIQEARQKLNSLVLPEGYHYAFAGEQEEMNKSFRELFFALILSILLVYMIIAAQFESLLFPFAVIFSIPFSFIGVIIALMLSGISLNVLSLIGLIILAGVVVNNAIVLIDYINQLRKSGLGRNEAVIEAGETRLRPILMTTLTTVLALVPMAIGLGEGAEMRAPLAVTIIGGLTSSTFLTLVFIPILYTYLDDLARKMNIQF
ncbi:MAG: efflux RND transporter permease subunit [Candidatus Atribacteria bacterium]|nr:efflux RND transporter permease subunit [Candidatus Atribacteria bacterium]